MSLSSTAISALKCQPKDRRSTDVRVAERLKDAGFVFFARAGAPDGARKIQLAKIGQASELAEFYGAHDSAGQLDRSDMNVARREAVGRPDGPVAPSSMTLPSQRRTHSAVSRSVAAEAKTAKKISAAVIRCIYRDILLDAGPTVRKMPDSAPGVFLLRRLILIGLAGTALWAQDPDFRTTLYPFWRRPTAAPATTLRAWRPRHDCIFRTRTLRPQNRGVRQFAGDPG